MAENVLQMGRGTFWLAGSTAETVGIGNSQRLRRRKNEKNLKEKGGYKGGSLHYQRIIPLEPGDKKEEKREHQPEKEKESPEILREVSALLNLAIT